MKRIYKYKIHKEKLVNGIWQSLNDGWYSEYEPIQPKNKNYRYICNKLKKQVIAEVIPIIL